MRFSFAAIFLSASMACASILEKARRLDQSSSGEFDFLLNYNLKVIACDSNKRVVGGSSGETNQAPIIFRLCPTSGECSDAAGKSCDAGYGDYLIGMNTFVQEYLQQNRDEMQNDDDSFQLKELGECRQYKADPDGAYADREFYVGPVCTADGTGVRMALFSDDTCEFEESTVTFEEISAGRSLPYSDGGLVSQYCESCYSANDNGEAGVNDLCRTVYDVFACETNMETFHYSGKREDGCQLISGLLTKSLTESTRSGSGVTVIGWLFFAMVVCGLAVGLSFTAMKKTKNGDWKYSLVS
jgi:hypothetical protein